MEKNKSIKDMPVTVTVASEQEPIKCDGIYSESGSSFVLEFSIGSDKFCIEHDIAKTRLKADGLMSYDIELTNGISSTLLATPYGEIRFKVNTVERSITRDGSNLHIVLKYVLSSETADELARDVDISVRFNS